MMPKDLVGCVNHRLRESRLNRQWSQQEVADRIGSTPNTISRWELGITSPGPYFRAKLCHLFGKTAEELGFLAEAREASTTGEILFDPAMPTFQSLVGRDDLLQQLIQRLLMCQKSTVLALHGLPGVGKTALATALAHEPRVQEQFRGGVLWAGLGPNPHIFGLLSHWGSVLGLASETMERLTGAKAWALALHTAIGDRRMLLVVDDVWCLDDALALQVGGAHCMHLVTTRCPNIALLLAGEDALLIPELSESDAFRLFANLAPQAAQSEQEQVQMLIQSVGGLPLAVRLISKHLHFQCQYQQPQRLHRALEQLSDAKKRLQLTLPQALIEQPPHLPLGTPLSLQATITVSDQHLDDVAREALRALAWLPSKPNTFSEEAALSIANVGGDTLDRLCDTGLLASCGAGRYMIHQTIVDYARAQGMNRQAQERIIAYFMALVESRDEHDERLEREVENILAAFQLACQHENWPLLVRGITAFAPFLAARGMYPLVQPFLLQARQTLAQSEHNYNRERAEISFHLGRIADFQGAYQEADKHYAAGWEYARSAGDDPLIVLLLAYWGEMLNNAGQYQRGAKVLLEGLQLAQAGEYHHQTCLCFKNLGEIAASLGNIAQAKSYHGQGLALARSIEHEEMVSVLLQNLAAHHSWRGDFPQAEACYREALTHARQISHLQRCSAALSGLGYTLLRQHRFVEAERCLKEGLALARKIQSPVRTSCVLQNLGIAKSEQGKYADAEDYLRESLSIATAIGHTWLIGETLYYQGELLLKQDRLLEAQAAFERASKRAREQHEQELIALTSFGLARVLWTRSNARQAEAHAEESLALFRTLEHEQAVRVECWLQGKR